MPIGATGPFWARSPYIDPDSLFGGVRTREAVMQGLQADAFREASQSQQVGQAASSYSGAATTNDQSQNAEVSQDVTAINTKDLELNSHAQTLFTPLQYFYDSGGGTYVPAELTTGLNDLVNSVGAYVYANDDHPLVAGDDIYITGQEYDGSAIATAHFIYGATPGQNGTTLEDLIDFVNGANAGPGGAIDKFTTGTLELLTGPEDKGILKLNADMGGPGDMAIDIDAPDAHVTTPKDAALTARTTEVITGAAAPGVATTLDDASTGAPNDASLSTTFANLAGHSGAAFANGDQILFTGFDSTGAFFSDVYAIADVTAETLGDLATAIEAAIPDASSITISGGQMRLTAEHAGDVPLALVIGSTGPGNNSLAPFGAFTDNPSTNPSAVTGENAYASFTLDHDTAATNVTAATGLNDLDLIDDATPNPLNTGDIVRVTGTEKDGDPIDVDFVYGTDGTTVGDLIDFLNGVGVFADVFPDATASLDVGDPGTLRVTEDDNSATVALDLQLIDKGKHINFQDFGGPDRLPMFGLHATNDLGDFLARGAAKLVQDQGGDQSAMAKLNDFAGDNSTSFNRISQAAQGSQLFDVDLTSTVYNCTLANQDGSAWNAARFRSIEALDNLNMAQAIFSSGQRQGHAQDPLTQVAVSDGADADNTLAQTATISQTGEVSHTGQHIMTRNERAPLMPRSTDLLARITDNSSVNSSAAAQGQMLFQSAAGGTDEAGNVTENDGQAQNRGGSRATNTDAVEVTNSISIMI